MISDRSAPIDFGAFCEKLDTERNAASENRWLTMSVKFFAEIEKEKDFRCVRMKRLVIHLTNIKVLLQSKSLPENYIDNKNQYKKKLNL